MPLSLRVDRRFCAQVAECDSTDCSTQQQSAAGAAASAEDRDLASHVVTSRIAAREAARNVRVVESFELRREVSRGGFQSLVETHTTKALAAPQQAQQWPPAWQSPRLRDADAREAEKKEEQALRYGYDESVVRTTMPRSAMARAAAARAAALHAKMNGEDELPPVEGGNVSRELVYLDEGGWHWAQSSTAESGEVTTSYTPASGMVQDVVTGRADLTRPGDGERRQARTRRGDEALPGYENWQSYIDWRGHESGPFVSDAVVSDDREPLYTPADVKRAAAGEPGSLREESKAHAAAAAAIERAVAIAQDPRVQRMVAKGKELAPKVKEKAPQAVSAGLAAIGTIGVML